MIGTSTFSSTTIVMVDYEMEDHVYEINYEEFRLAREACDEVNNPRLVVDAIGPTIRTGSFILSVEYPSFLNVTFKCVGWNIYWAWNSIIINCWSRCTIISFLLLCKLYFMIIQLIFYLCWIFIYNKSWQSMWTYLCDLNVFIISAFN